MVFANMASIVIKFILQMNVKYLKNLRRHIVKNDTPSYAITLKNTTGVNLAYAALINMITNCKIPIKQDMTMFVKK